MLLLYLFHHDRHVPLENIDQFRQLIQGCASQYLTVLTQSFFIGQQITVLTDLFSVHRDVEPRLKVSHFMTAKRDKKIHKIRFYNSYYITQTWICQSFREKKAGLLGVSPINVLGNATKCIQIRDSCFVT